MTMVNLAGSDIPVSTIYCIGRNYAAHAAELNNQVESEPLVFLKPQASLLRDGSTITLPAYSNDVHHEVEVVMLIGRGGSDIPLEEALTHVAGYGVGLDLTARDVQDVAKKKGHPWTKAKGFPGAACVSELVAAKKIDNPMALDFTLTINNETRQRGDTGNMLFPFDELVSYLSRIYTLRSGDLIFTGTPEGVGPIYAGDRLILTLEGFVTAHFTVAG